MKTLATALCALSLVACGGEEPPPPASTVTVEVDGVTGEEIDQFVFSLVELRDLGLFDNEDANQNGILDDGEDANGNGLLDRTQLDANGDGIVDAEDELSAGILLLVGSDREDLCEGLSDLFFLSTADGTFAFSFVIQLKSGADAGTDLQAGATLTNVEPQKGLADVTLTSASFGVNQGGAQVLSRSGFATWEIEALGETLSAEITASLDLDDLTSSAVAPVDFQASAAEVVPCANADGFAELVLAFGLLGLAPGLEELDP